MLGIPNIGASSELKVVSPHATEPRSGSGLGYQQPIRLPIVRADPTLEERTLC